MRLAPAFKHTNPRQDLGPCGSEDSGCHREVLRAILLCSPWKITPNSVPLTESGCRTAGLNPEVFIQTLLKAAADLHM